MGKSILPSIQKVTWQDVRKQVKSVNPNLFKILDELDAPYPLYKAIYPFGHESVKKGKLHLPNKENKIVPLSDSSIDPSIQSDLEYNIGTNPATLVLSNMIEIFCVMEKHTIPSIFVTPGKLISLGPILEKNTHYNYQPAFLWYISSGARSLFMLPKISVTDKLEKIRVALKLDIKTPRSLLDHGQLFQTLANSTEFGETWTCELLYFSKSWFEHFKLAEWRAFYDYLFHEAWDRTGYWRNEFVWDLIFSFIQERNNLKPNPYIADTVRHLLSMGVGAYPGFAPTIDNSAGPISRLQEIFCDIYQLDRYQPIIMQPAYFSVLEPCRPIYYSLEYPTTLNFSPKSRKRVTKMINLVELHYVLNKYLVEISSNSLNTHGSVLGSLSKKTCYDFYHSEARNESGIHPSREIPSGDPTFAQSVKKYPDREFPENSPFLRGCIRLSHKEKT
jgi:hypothetical protein